MQPVDVGARVVARITHHIPGFKKLNKSLEGRNERAGFSSDLTALLINLYNRNQELFNALAGNAAEGLIQNMTTPKQGTPPGADAFVDFGPQSPIGSANNNGHGG